SSGMLPKKQETDRAPARLTTISSVDIVWRTTTYGTNGPFPLGRPCLLQFLREAKHAKGLCSHPSGLVRGSGFHSLNSRAAHSRRGSSGAVHCAIHAGRQTRSSGRISPLGLRLLRFRHEL